MLSLYQKHIRKLINSLQLSHFPIHRNYWKSQAIGWTIIFIFHLVILFSVADEMRISYIFLYIVFALSGLIMSHIYRELMLQWGWLEYPMHKILPRVISANIIVSFLWVDSYFICSYLLDAITDKEWEKIYLIYWISWVNSGFIITLWSLLYFGFHFFKNYKQSEIDKWKLQSSVKEAELLALKSQINPHFLFNSLNNIRSLVAENPDKARDMITHLSDLLRYSIQLNSSEQVTLAKELDVVQDYLQLESIQFEERLKYRFDIDKNALQMKVPPMVIQILVENAIKHGIAHLPKGGEIIVKVQVKGDELDIEVVNTGQLTKGTEGSGIGLKNASQRLKLLANSLKSIQLNNLDENMVSARFSIPILSNKLLMNK